MPDAGTPLTIALLAITMVPALGVLSWCWSYDCTEGFSPKHDPHGEPFAKTYHSASGGERVCWPLIVHHGAGKELRPDYSNMQCQLVATAKDPNDNWHEVSP